MKGHIEQNGTRYEWWAGKASPEAEGEYCVHCRNGDYGVTRYYDNEPDQNEAETTARKLIPVVRQLN